MWTEEARERHAPGDKRYPSDLTDGEWTILSPLVPPARRGGRPRAVDMREVLNGILYVLRTGCQWRQLPKDLPPHTTVYGYLWEWSRYGILDRMHNALLVAERERQGREASPTAAIIDSQSVKATEKGGAALILSDMTQARRLKGSRETPSSTRSACSLASR